MALDAVPTSPTFNCYVTRADAAVFIGDMLYAPNWAAAASDAVRDKALITATYMLDRYVRWTGSVTVADQNLSWPRQMVQMSGRPYGTYLPSNVVPDIIQLATTEYAEAMLGENLVSEDAQSGLSAIGVGPISLNFNRLDRKNPVPASVRKLIEMYGTVSTGKASTATLVRT